MVFIDLVSDDEDVAGGGEAHPLFSSDDHDDAMDWEASNSEASDESDDDDAVVNQTRFSDDLDEDEDGSRCDEDDDDDDDDYADTQPGWPVPMAYASPRRQSDQRRHESAPTCFENHCELAVNLFHDGLAAFRAAGPAMNEALFVRRHAENLSHLVGIRSPWIPDTDAREKWEQRCQAATTVAALETLYEMLHEQKNTLDRHYTSMGKIYHGREGYRQRAEAAAAAATGSL